MKIFKRSYEKLQAKLEVTSQWSYAKLLGKLGNGSLLGEVRPLGLGETKC